MFSDFFEENDLSWNNLVAVCTDGALATIGSRSGFTALFKPKNPRIRGPHCLLHQQALASKTLLKTLKTVLEIIISSMNYEVHSISFQTFFVQAFVIAVNSRYFSMLLLYSL